MVQLGAQSVHCLGILIMLDPFAAVGRTIYYFEALVSGGELGETRSLEESKLLVLLVLCRYGWVVLIAGALPRVHL